MENLRYLDSHEVYRVYDVDDALLYVGCALETGNGLKGHSDEFWFPRAARVELEVFPTRRQALEAEKLAIINEHPLFNVVHNTRQPPTEEDRGDHWVSENLKAAVEECTKKFPTATVATRWAGGTQVSIQTIDYETCLEIVDFFKKRGVHLYYRTAEPARGRIYVVDEKRENLQVFLRLPNVLMNLTDEVMLPRPPTTPRPPEQTRVMNHPLYDRALDLAGETFGTLVVIERVSNSAHGQTRWRVRCLCCGVEKICIGNNLRQKLTRSCGSTKCRKSLRQSAEVAA